MTYQQYLEIKQQHPNKYARDLASHLNMSEAELLHIRLGHDVVSLKIQLPNFITDLQQLGEVKTITRNEYAVHEQIGHYSNQKIEGNIGLVLNAGGLDLRLFLTEWNYLFAVEEQTSVDVRHSFQIFDKFGTAIHKIYTTKNTDMQTWQAVVERYAEHIPAGLEVQKTQSSPHTTLSTNAIQTFEQAWRNMTDVHQFHGLLKKYNLDRKQSFHLVSDDLAYQVDNQAIYQLLDIIKTEQNRVMVFVGNRGCVQIYSGKLEKVVEQRGWLNIFNPNFTLHLLANKISETWVTKKPTIDGIITSLELFAEDDSLILQLFGERAEGQPEQVKWREQISSLAPILESVS